MTIGQFLDKVPWDTMRYKDGLIRQVDTRLCPIAATFGGDNVAYVRTACQQGIHWRDAAKIALAADGASWMLDRGLVRLRMLWRMWRSK